MPSFCLTGLLCRDWKKLTFYYFADSYINFNSLVTDLFKIYKTRIWMSAINPASFASPTLGLQAPSGIGPGAVDVGRGMSNPERRQNPPLEQPNTYSNATQPGRGFQSNSFPQSYSNDRTVVQSAAYPQAAYPYGGGQYGGAAFAGPNRQQAAQYVPSLMQSMDSYPGIFPQNTDFASMRSRGYLGGQGPSPDPTIAAQGEWISQFSGLSLNSR